MAETNWPAQYVRHNFYREAAGKGFFLHVCTQQNLSVLGEEARCTFIAALITEFGSDASPMTEHPHFLSCASPGWHGAPGESRDLGETSPGKSK